MKTTPIRHLFCGVSKHIAPSAFWLALAGWMLAAGSGFAQPRPFVQLEGVPSAPLIGSTFTFRIWFSNIGTTPGFIPCIELCVDAGGADLNTACANNTLPGCDGLEILSITGDVDAGYNNLGFYQGVFNSGATAPCPPTQTTVTHPYAGSGVLPVTICPGAQLRVIKLLNGVVLTTPAFPRLYVDVKVKISEYADPNHPLRIQVRGLFAFGATHTDQHAPVLDPVSGLNNNLCNGSPQNPQTSWDVHLDVMPQVFTVSKIYFGSEDETATGPNNLHYYGLVVDIAPNQTISRLNIRDIFPPNMAFQNAVTPMVWQNPSLVVGATAPNYFSGILLSSGLSCPGAGYTVATPPLPAQAYLNPDNELNIDLCNPITGLTGLAVDDPEVAVQFAVFIPEEDAGGNLILNPANCITALSTNDGSARGDWLPLDCRDPLPANHAPTLVVSDVPATSDHILQAKCVAIQKSWGPQPPFTRLPTQTITYVLFFQVSDYRTLNQVEIVDFLSDGQELCANGPAPALEVTDQFGTTVGTFDPGNLTLIQEADQTAICRDFTPFVPASATKLTFKVSALMSLQNPSTSRHGQGIITGGLAVPGVPSSVAAWGRITFCVTVQDQFNHAQDPSHPNDKPVFKDDFLDNCVTFSGVVLDNVSGDPAVPIIATGGTAEDMSQVRVPITGTKLTKSIEAIKHVDGSSTLNPSGTVTIAPGDEVTFRLQMQLPASDGKNLTIRDWFSTPVFRVDDPDADGNLGETWASSGPLLSAAFSTIPPLPGEARNGPNLPSFNGWFGPLFGPVTVNAYYPPLFPSENTLEFLYNRFNDPGNTPRLLDILYTVTASSEPFGDGYNIVNEATECEDNTFSNTTNLCTSADVKMIMGEPKLKLTKGVVATTDPYAVFSQPPFGGGLTVSAPGTTTCPTPRFTGTAGTVVNSGNLATFPRLQSDITMLAAGSIVTFAMVVENLGLGPRGAFRVTVRDMLPTSPACFTLIPNTICVQYGDPTVTPPTFTYTVNSTPTAPELVLDDPSNGFTGALAAYDASSGLNIVIVTLDAAYTPPSGTQPGDCCVNHAELTDYSNVPAGANFVTTANVPDLVAQADDDAQVCLVPALGPIIMDCPDDIVVNCTSPNGALVNYAVPTATSSGCAAVSVSCIPPPSSISGQPFPIGVTTVTCTALACGHTLDCTFLVTVVGNGGPTQGQWARCDGGAGSQIANAIAVDAAGNSYVAGTYTGSATFTFPNTATTITLPNSGGEDVFLARYDTAGGLLWVVRAGGPGNDAALSVAVDALGNCSVAGGFHGTATFFDPASLPVRSITVGSAGTDRDIFLARYDSQGVCLWAVASGGPNDDLGTGVAVNGVGDCYLTGTFQSQLTLNSAPGVGVSFLTTGAGTADCFLARYTPAGAVTLLGASSGVGNYYAQSRGVAVGAQGRAWIVGLFSGMVAFGPHALTPAANNSLAFVAHHNPGTGPWAWARQTSCGNICGNHDGRAIGADALNNCYFTAYYSGDARIGSPPIPVSDPNGLNLYDCLIGSFYPDGTARWLKNGLPPSLTDQEPRGLAVDPAGFVYVTGFLRGPGLFAAAGNDVWLRKYDSGGILHWTEQGLGSTTSQGNSGRGVAVDPSGCVYVTGSFTDPLAFSSFANPSAGMVTPPSSAEEIFLTKYCPPCGCDPVSLVTPLASLTITTLPTLTSTVDFTVTVGGSPPFKYYWQHNGIPINLTGDPLLPASGSCYEVTVNSSTSTLKLTCLPNSSQSVHTFSVVVENYWCQDQNVSSAATLTYIRGPEINIATNTVWRYLDDGSDQGTAWRGAGFDDSGWSNGVALFGVDNPGIYPWPFLTPMPVGGGRITYYFRTHFNWSGPTAGAVLNVTGYFDDGAAFYLNGVEAGRVRLTNEPVWFDSLAQNQGAEGTADVLTLSSANLIPGDNVLAVEVHQTSPDSGDAVFGLTLEGTLPPSLSLACASNKTVVCDLAAATNPPTYTVLRSFLSAGGDGHTPRGVLLEGLNGVLYGTTPEGGGGGLGTVFKVNQDGSGYTVLKSFNGGNGREPWAGLIQDSDGWLYGTTRIGGSGLGTVFKLDTNGGLSVLHSFSDINDDGQQPRGKLVEVSDGLLYGTTFAGGTHDRGTVFRLSKDGSNYTVLHHFSTDPTNGVNPLAGLTAGSDGILYGTTRYGGGGDGGIAGSGTVFKLNRDGSGFSVLHSFSTSTGSQGHQPFAGVVQGPDGLLYGTTFGGGTVVASGGYGTIFKLNTDGSGFQRLKSFTGPDGRNPQADLMVDANGIFYGTTYNGGSDGQGVIFKLNLDGSGYMVLKDFTGAGGDGANPFAGVIRGRDNALYGTTEEGGNNGVGTLFRLQLPCSWSFDPPTVVDACCGGSNVTLAVLSTVTNGVCPTLITRTWQATDCCSNSVTCSQTVTLVDTSPLAMCPPFIITQPQNQLVTAGSNASFTVVAAGTPPLRYQWRFKGAAIPDATDATLTVLHVGADDEGEYDVVISNEVGSTTSTPRKSFATGPVMPPIPPHQTQYISVPDSRFHFRLATSRSRATIPLTLASFPPQRPLYSRTLPLTLIPYPVAPTPSEIYSLCPSSAAARTMVVTPFMAMSQPMHNRAIQTT